jgi:hypothetical protein
MSVNRIEPHLLTLHSQDGDKTLEIEVVGETISFRVTNNIGQPTATEIEGVTKDQVKTIEASLYCWANHGTLDFLRLYR